eukprot:Phypoly_transcript_12958.p1 GENE.Phypoly_transcript_12958~~Phypoly_transcript_12958.p1  ORF type:complete len:278 (+),score=38.63 Phypoly_transcript_12958:169-1002(+)
MRGIKQKHKDIYKRYAQQYDMFKAKQDYNNILIQKLLDIVGFDIHTKAMLELGSGTGKLAIQLSKHVKSVVGIDISSDMVTTAMHRRNSENIHNCDFILGDYRNIPFRSSLFSVIVAGWAFSYLKVNYPYTDPEIERKLKEIEKEYGEEGEAQDTKIGWVFQLQKTLQECRRVLTNDGMLIILESRGVAYNSPTRAGSWYYKYLQSIGFTEDIVRTDYMFDSLSEAETQMKFFFGKVVANRVRNNAMEENVSEKNQKTIVVPEFTGVWWIYKEQLHV